MLQGSSLCATNARCRPSCRNGNSSGLGNADPSGARLGDYGSAPNLVAAGPWYNTAGTGDGQSAGASPALTMSGLRGKVVLVDFWTYSCVNCVRTIPYLKAWNDAYRDKGFVIIGVHTPEFEFEKNS